MARRTPSYEGNLCPRSWFEIFRGDYAGKEVKTKILALKDLVRYQTLHGDGKARLLPALKELLKRVSEEAGSIDEDELANNY